MDSAATSPLEKVFKTYLDELYENGLLYGMEQGWKKGYKKGWKMGYEQGLKKGQMLAIKTFLLKNPDWTDRQVSFSFEVEESLVQQLRNEIQ
jgi:flagellar biosynthesis/type III secretory pathway protein FliH